MIYQEKLFHRGCTLKKIVKRWKSTQVNFLGISLQFWFTTVNSKTKRLLIKANSLSRRILCLQSGTTLLYDNNMNLNLYGIGNSVTPISLSHFSVSNQSFIPSKITAMFVKLAGRKTLFLSDAASFATIGVKARTACTIYLKCMTVRIIAMSNPLGLQRVPVRLMHDNCQGDKRAVTMPRVR